MKICASYHAIPAKVDKVDEIRYSINKLDQALEASEKYPDKKIIIEIRDIVRCNVSADKLTAIGTENPNIILDLYSIDDLKSLRQNGFNNKTMYHYPVTNFNELRYLLWMNPCSIMLTEPLTFMLPKVQECLDHFESSASIRVHPSIGRPTEWNNFKSKDPGLFHFWIIPQWLPYYEPYVDVIELYDADPEREKALIDIYTKGSFADGLHILLKNCESSIPCAMLDEEMALKRVNCGQTCMQGRCHYCDMFVRTAELAHPNHKEVDLKNNKKYDTIYSER